MKTTTRNGAAKAARTNTSNSSSTINPSDPFNGLATYQDGERLYHHCNRPYMRGGVEAEIKRLGYHESALPERVRWLVAEEQARKATIRCDVELPAWIYGHLCAAAAVHKADFRKMVVALLDEHTCEWSNRGYFLPNSYSYLTPDEQDGVTVEEAHIDGQLELASKLTGVAKTTLAAGAVQLWLSKMGKRERAQALTILHGCNLHGLRPSDVKPAAA